LKVGAQRQPTLEPKKQNERRTTLPYYLINKLNKDKEKKLNGLFFIQLII